MKNQREFDFFRTPLQRMAIQMQIIKKGEKPDEFSKNRRKTEHYISQNLTIEKGLHSSKTA